MEDRGNEWTWKCGSGSVGELERSCSDSQNFAELFVAEFPAILAERSGRNVAESESADVAEF